MMTRRIDIIMVNEYIENPKMKGSGVLGCIPQTGTCPIKCVDCFFQSGRSYLEPLSENLPNIPSIELAKGKIVRINDGNDSNHERDLVVFVAEQYEDYFYNTSINKDIEGFKAPVVLTVNPGEMTDNDFHKSQAKNLMFVRARVNIWNLPLIDAIIDFYKNICPVVLTFMAYYTETIPELCRDKYEFKKRVLNSYYCLKPEYLQEIKERYEAFEWVYYCNSGACIDCNNCKELYLKKKEELNG